MNKNVFKLAILLCSLLFMPVNGHPHDHGGCLVCHRYPGLVKSVNHESFKVLHIDEDKHLSSPHGKTDCRQCHPNTVQIPHTDVTDVECNKKCHVDDKDKIDSISPDYLKNFHREERFAITRLDDETSCRVCHSLYPHHSNNKVRAFANMHTGFMLCEVCHMKKRNGELTYDWKPAEEFEYTGEPYGSHEKRQVKKDKDEGQHSVVSKMLKMFDAEEGKKESHEVRHFISRIAVYHLEKEEKTLFINTADNERAREYLAREKSLSAKEKEKELKFFHRDIAKKEISVACNECHSPKGVMDFEQLGFNKQRSNDLKYMNIKSLLTKYDTFVIPNLFGPKR